MKVHRIFVGNTKREQRVHEDGGRMADQIERVLTPGRTDDRVNALEHLLSSVAGHTIIIEWSE